MKTVRKIIPVSLYDIPGLESWLEEQAREGLFPQRLSPWATFLPTGVPGTRFRLEVCGREWSAPEPDRLELYRAQGWDYAFTVGSAYHLFYTLDPSAPELYTDYESRGMNLEQLERRERRQRILHGLIWTALVLVVVLLLLLRNRFDVQPNSFALIPLLLFYICQPILLILLPLVIFYWRIHRRDTRTFRATCRALSMGLPPPPSPGPSRAIQWENRITLALIIPLFLMVFGQWYYLNRWDGVPLSDLLARLELSSLHVPPLRERREDIIPLAEHVLRRYAAERQEEGIRRISYPALELLTRYYWPGNVSELKNCLLRAAQYSEDQVIRAGDLPPSLQTAESSATEAGLSLGDAVTRFEKELLVDALIKAGGNMLKAARDLKSSYRIVNYKVKKYGIDPHQFAFRSGQQ